MHRALQKADIRNACGDRAFVRGLDYARSQRVLEVKRHERDDGWFIEARVRGTNLYRQQIRVSQFDGHIEIDGECTCPVGYNCKHVAAALISLGEQMRPDPLERQRHQIAQWVGQLRASRTPVTREQTPAAQVILYVLGPAQHAPQQVQVRLHVCRVLQHGGRYGKGRPVSRFELRGGRFAQAVQPDDRTILGLIAGVADYTSIILHGELGALALQRMVASGRARWLSSDSSALQPGEPRRLEATWHDEDGVLRLALATDPPGGQVVGVDPPHYIDPASAACGPLQLPPGMNQETLAALGAAPAVPRTLAVEVSDLLLERLPDMAVPLPAARRLRELHGIAPRPVLQLSAHRLPLAGVERLVHMAGLAFDYAGHRLGLPLEPVGQLADQDGVVRITRDTAREQAALQTLLDLGFQSVQAAHQRAPVLIMAARELVDSALAWQGFLDAQLPALRDAGWIIEQDDSFALRFVQADSIDLEIDEGEGWFDLGIGIDIEGRRVDLVPLLAQLLERIDRVEDLPDDRPVLVEVEEAQWLELPAARVKPLLATLFDLFGRALPGDRALRLSRLDAVRLHGLDDGVVWRGGEGLRQLAQRLADLDGLPPVEPPVGLEAELRPYQLHGLAWLQFLRETGFGGVLADDMGLGKTVQTLAHCLLEKEAGRLDRPALIVAPTSLMANWRHEAARFAPGLRVLTLHGPQRKADFGRIAEHDLVLTTYPLLARDREALEAQAFHLVVLDEAQTIKNPRTGAAQVARALDTRHRLCLTGTPMENHLGELWSLFHFLSPGFLGDQQQFRRQFRVPIEQQGDVERRSALQRRIAPFLLRRTKQAVATELPDKIEIVRTVALDEAQAGLYESVRAAMDRKIRDALDSKGLARSHITILEALLKLRQICCDPRLLKLERAPKAMRSAKLDLLLGMLPELLDEGRRILLFSQFTSMLGLIESELDRLGIGYSKLTGQTRKREEAIERFRSGEVPLFLISLKAGGVGLNLTEADTVIHYDPWWNPAAEVQATDRAHRIGQTSTVFVYKLVTEQTVEERILALQARKAALARGIYREGAGDQQPWFDERDVEALLSPLD
jgi:superfamily II DNA or RNA helicase